MSHSLSTSTEEIWESFSRRLHGFFASRVGDKQVASDLVQETFLRIHSSLSSLGEGDRLDAWVFRIARNLLTDHYRVKGRTTSLTADVLADESTDDDHNKLVGGWLIDAIDKTPPMYREALRLHEIEGLSQRAIARQLGLSHSGAKSRVQRGREKLRQLISECCRIEQDRRGNVIDYSKSQPDCCDD